MRRIRLTVIAALCSLVLLGALPGQAAAQGGAQVYRDPGTGRLIYVADLSGRQPGEVRIGFTNQVYWFFNPFDPLQPAFGCTFAFPGFPHLAFCQDQPPLSIRGLLVQLGPGPNDARVVDPFPLLPGPNLIQGNSKADKVQGGPSDEQINAGKGNDKANPGDGKDKLNLGAGDDKANTRDGQPDNVNGGKGDDEAKVDKKDKLKNVEKAQRK